MFSRWRLKFWLPLGLTALTGCVSSPKTELARLRTGMDKSDVLTEAGNPRRTYRTEGRDHWVYTFEEGNSTRTTDVEFTRGRVTRVGHPGPEDERRRRLEDARDMDEFETEARRKSP